MTDLSYMLSSSPPTADTFTVSVLVLISAIIALFIVMKNKLKKK